MSWHLTWPPEMFLLKSALRYSCAYAPFPPAPAGITSLHWRKAAVLTCKSPLVSMSCG